MRYLLAFLALLFASCKPSSGPGAAKKAPEDDLGASFQKAERIVFLGDGITFAGGYVDDFEVFFRLNYARAHLRLLDLALPDETVSGVSEPGYAGGQAARPALPERLDTILEKTKPEVVFACYGMSDGLHEPFDERRFKKYQAALRQVHNRVRARGASIVFLTPPAEDGYRGPDTTPATTPSAYNEVLARYAAWLVEQRSEGWHVVDFFSLTHGHPPMRGADGQRALGGILIEELHRQGLDYTAAYQQAHLAQKPTVSELVKRRRQLLADAWLQECSPSPSDRPANGPSLPEAEKQAAALEKRIAAELEL